MTKMTKMTKMYIPIEIDKVDSILPHLPGETRNSIQKELDRENESARTKKKGEELLDSLHMRTVYQITLHSRVYLVVLTVRRFKQYGTTETTRLLLHLDPMENGRHITPYECGKITRCQPLVSFNTNCVVKKVYDH